MRPKNSFVSPTGWPPPPGPDGSSSEQPAIASRAARPRTRVVRGDLMVVSSKRGSGGAPGRAPSITDAQTIASSRNEADRRANPGRPEFPPGPRPRGRGRFTVAGSSAVDERAHEPGELVGRIYGPPQTSQRVRAGSAVRAYAGSCSAR